MADGDKVKQDSPGEDVTDADPVPSSHYQKGQHGINSALPVAMETEEEFESTCYKMDYPERGMALIINNKTFQQHTGMGVRHGTDADASGLYQRFKVLGFDVDLKNNITRYQMKMELEKAASRDHRNADCFVCAILSHGEEGVIYGTDGTVQIKDLVEPFKGNKCPSLAGKPKIFFIQACRGTDLDSGVDVADSVVVSDAKSDVVYHRIPTEADFLMAYSVVPGYFSWRNSTNGSWFIQAVVAVLEKHGEKMDLLTMMTRVNKQVAYDFYSKASKAYMSNKKQIPCITSMLTKEVYFHPK